MQSPQDVGVVFITGYGSEELVRRTTEEQHHLSRPTLLKQLVEGGGWWEGRGERRGGRKGNGQIRNKGIQSDMVSDEEGETSR